ncbi:MAG TPA: glycosyltransferase family 39 protein, partial [Anaerolineae bacterium]
EAKIGIPLDYGNKNLVVHTSAEQFPWHNTALAVHLIRFLSILFSALTVVFTYFFALEIKPNDKTLAAVSAALVAFNPMFIFISASVNNDNLAVMLASLALLLLARLITRGATLPRFIVLGIVLGFAALSKVSDLGLLVVAAVVFSYLLWRAWKMRGGDTPAPPHPHTPALPLGVVTGSLLCAAIVVAIAGWWYVRNWLLYADPLAFNVWVAIAGGRPTPATLATLLGEFQGFRISFWGNFGGVNIIAPDWVYVVLDLFTVLAAIGLLVGLARRALPRLLALPGFWLALILVSLLRWTLLTFASQGRLIFPAISAVAILIAYGLSQFQISDFRFQISRFRFPNLPFAHLSFVIFLFTFSALAPFTLIAPAYALPARLPSDASVPNQTHITFDDQAELVGYALPQKSVAPGDELPITIYWRANARIAEDFSVYIRLFDMTDQIVGRWEAFPGGGLYPTRLWQPGEIIVDNYRVPVSLDARGPGVGRIEVGLFRRLPLENLTARDPQGHSITPTIARFKITGPSQVQVEGAQSASNFGDQI